MKDNEARALIRSLEAKIVTDRIELTSLRLRLEALAFSLKYKIELDVYSNFVARPVCKECEK